MFIWSLLLILRYTVGSLFILILLPFSSFLKKRSAFEKEWGFHRVAETQFDVWFHVSSEGELEQILPWLDNRILKGKKVLVLFTSPSLIHRATQFHSPQKGLAFACFPLTLIFPFGKASLLSGKLPSEFFMVRYDFFPELLWVANHVERSVLLAGTLKGKQTKVKRPLGHWWYLKIFSSFDKIFASTDGDKEGFKKLLETESVEVESLDFRHGSILKRQREKKNLESQPAFSEFLKESENYPWNKRLIFGSLWPSELDIFSENFLKFIKKENIFIFLAPHHLKGENWDQIENFLIEFKNYGIQTALWKKDGETPDFSRSQVILCQVPGLLCEIYPFFGHAFIGGGHGRSIHSLLEPYWGGGHLYFGPKTHRSTEFD
ncbi:unnamed protein product, partial [Chrysoparadoxa australica]